MTTYAPHWTTRDADLAWFEHYDPDVVEAFIDCAFDFPGTSQSCWLDYLGPDGESLTPIRRTRDEELPPPRFLAAYTDSGDLKAQRDRFFGTILVNVGFNPWRRPAVLLEGTDCDAEFFDIVKAMIGGLDFVDGDLSGRVSVAYTEARTEYFVIVLNETGDQAGEMCDILHRQLATLTF